MPVTAHRRLANLADMLAHHVPYKLHELRKAGHQLRAVTRTPQRPKGKR